MYYVQRPRGQWNTGTSCILMSVGESIQEIKTVDICNARASTVSSGIKTMVNFYNNDSYLYAPKYLLIWTKSWFKNYLCCFSLLQWIYFNSVKFMNKSVCDHVPRLQIDMTTIQDFSCSLNKLIKQILVNHDEGSKDKIHGWTTSLSQFGAPFWCRF